MFPKTSNIPRMFLFSLLFGFFIAAFIFGLMQLFAPLIEIEGLHPLVTKLTVKERQQSRAQVSVSSLLKVTTEARSSKNLSLNFQITTDQGNDLLVLVNKKISLPASFVPDNLVGLNGIVSSYPGIELKKEAAEALKEMFTAAKQDRGINYSVVSAYRSYKEQVLVFNSWVGSAGLPSAELFSAKAGHSQHQLGTAVDISVPNQVNFSDSLGSTVEGIWLAENSYKYGYTLAYPKGKESITGYSYEPWHFRYIGKENTQKMVDLGLILEEFLQRYGIW